MSIKKTILLIVITISSAIVLIPLLFWLFFSSLIPTPPKPEITYGQIPFELMYELNSETITIQDVAICEFNGYGPKYESGQSRKWKTHLQSGNDKLVVDYNKSGFIWITLSDLRDKNLYDDSGNKILELYFFGGNAHYYMSDELGNHHRDAQGLEYINYFYQKSDGTTGHGYYSAEDAFEKYNIRLISWQTSEPIPNNFG